MKNKQTEQLIKLIKENPELEVVPMVDYEVVADDGGYWLGKFGFCEVGEYTTYNDRFYDDKDSFIEDYYNDTYDDGRYDGLTDDEVDKLIAKETADWWTKAIIVYIGV